MDDKTASAGRTLNIGQIMDMIPHRPPFLMIDRVLDIIRDVSATGVKDLTGKEDYFAGHFPGHPIMPGVLIIEAMAQTAAVLVMDAAVGEHPGALVYFMSVEQARFRRPVGPGDSLHLHVEKVQNRGKVWKFKGEARVDGALKAEAVFTAMLVEDK